MPMLGIEKLCWAKRFKMGHPIFHMGPSWDSIRFLDPDQLAPDQLCKTSMICARVFWWGGA